LVIGKDFIDLQEVSENFVLGGVKEILLYTVTPHGDGGGEWELNRNDFTAKVVLST
jgi:hypothetical protein